MSYRCCRPSSRPIQQRGQRRTAAIPSSQSPCPQSAGLREYTRRGRTAAQRGRPCRAEGSVAGVIYGQGLAQEGSIRAPPSRYTTAECGTDRGGCGVEDGRFGVWSVFAKKSSHPDRTTSAPGLLIGCRADAWQGPPSGVEKGSEFRALRRNGLGLVFLVCAAMSSGCYILSMNGRCRRARCALDARTGKGHRFGVKESWIRSGGDLPPPPTTSSFSVHGLFQLMRSRT